LLEVGAETVFRPELQVVRGAFPVELLVAFRAAMDLATEALERDALRESSRGHALLVVITLRVETRTLTVLFLLLSRWLGTGLAVFLTPVPVHLLTLAFLDFAGRRHGERVDHGLRLLQAHDGATQMVLQPQPHGHEGVHHIWG